MDVNSVAAPGAVISLSELCANYGRQIVLKNLSLTVSSGDLVGLVGPNGSGKTTLLKVLLGLLPVVGGAGTVLGQDLSGRPGGHAVRRLRRRIAWLPQASATPSLPVSVAELVLLGRWGRSFGWLRRPDATDRRLVAEALETVGLADLAGRQFASLSGGQLQRALLARCLVRQPELLLMDEPATWLDREAKAELLREVISAHSRLGITMLIVSHEALPGRAFDRIVRLAAPVNPVRAAGPDRLAGPAAGGDHDG
ncbi:MAG: hypothetical protein A2087_07240 [Spirochaetes bacterium GWD1_61_31]|nr:MAG: hypothetical protein A2Y37_08235 [Spirochaetes bacterium GWB1_60_80]OHD34207.1 MAG: hypothetical protein A2004_12510 [Spirochaetes bacterium GWC1_61_12]OHD40135.1 MAG: hypothetical protein A2087_07240 [Spirochaetes bacterium GWD1_61_31]OHD45817.1 MAG: hypothetical protein A2Y35_03870 [Spirochaetes bacterium GWE1_60_18]OHD58360.1 MAG: hypothetical protein A2Y32_06260 [Spirochaetes bacterium GWF1_60_12]HAW86359.1 ABC transporter ATP-binding protein [Spirochaetaceae bacterium]